MVAGVFSAFVVLHRSERLTSLLYTLKTSSTPCYRVEPAQLRSALQALARLAADPQLLVDFFVNYDCDLQVPKGARRPFCCWLSAGKS